MPALADNWYLALKKQLNVVFLVAKKNNLNFKVINSFFLIKIHFSGKLNDCEFKLPRSSGVGPINPIFWWWSCVFIDKAAKFAKASWKAKGGTKSNYVTNTKLKKEIKSSDNWIQ